jgi:hypothetical protein
MCITKMSEGGGGVYLGGEFDREERELRWPDKEIIRAGGRIGKRRRRRKKKGSGRTIMP